MTVQVTAPAKRLALPDPLPPLTVKQAPDNQNLDPLRVDRDDALTASFPTDGLESTDEFYIEVKGEEGTHPEASYTLGPIRLNEVGKDRPVNLRKSIVALLLGKKVTLTYTIVRDRGQPGKEEKTSIPLELKVLALEVKVPVARILEAQGNGHGFELDLTSGTRDLTARLDRWSLIAEKQLVWVTFKGKDAEGKDHNLTLLAPPEGTVSQRWEDLGYHELPIARGYLAKLGHDTTLTIEHRVAFDRVNDADAAVVFEDRTYTVKAIAVVKPEITSVKDSAGQDVADNGTTTDTTLTLRGTVESGKKVEIHDGNVWREGTTTGINWTYEASGLSAKTYAFKARVVGSTAESNTWTVTVQAAQVAPIITGMKDSAGQDVADNGTTTDTTLTLRGTVESGKKVEIHDGNAWREGATTGINWTYEASGLSAKTYAFKARVVGSTAESDTWTVTVETASDGKLAITQIIDALGNEIYRGGATTFAAATSITLKGTAVPEARVSVFDVFDLIDTQPARKSGRWTMTLGALKQKSYNFAISASDADSPALWPLSIMADGTPIIGLVMDKKGQVIAPYGETYEQVFTLSGQGTANGSIKVHELLGDTSVTVAVNAQGRWEHEVSVASPREYHYVASAPEAGSVKSNLWRVRVVKQP